MLIVIIILGFLLAVVADYFYRKHTKSDYNDEDAVNTKNMNKRKKTKFHVILASVAAIAILAVTPLLQLPAEFIIGIITGNPTHIPQESDPIITKNLESPTPTNSQNTTPSDTPSPSPFTTQTPNNKEQQVTVTEQHTPNDVATQVSYCDWDVENDFGITNKRYEGGYKVTITNFFTATGSTVDNDITSRLILQLPLNYADPIFTGTLVLHNSMFGSKSHGTIRILVNGEEKFSTGEISGDCTSDFPFNINIDGADSIIVEADVTVSGGKFEYGLVS